MQQSQNEFTVIQEAIQDKLEKRALLREEKVWTFISPSPSSNSIADNPASPPQIIRIPDPLRVSPAYYLSRGPYGIYPG